MHYVQDEDKETTRVPFIIIFLTFIYFERERETVCTGWGGAETVGERNPSRLHIVCPEPVAGLYLMKGETTT